MTATSDHVTVAIEDVDTQIAALNTQIGQLRERVDTLADARVQLVTARAAIAGASTIPLPEPAKPPTPAARPAAKKAPKSARKRPRSSGSKYDLAEVARIARDAAAAGRPMGPAVLAGIDECPSIAMAGILIKQARDDGYDIPTTRAPRTTTPKPATPARRTEEQVPGKQFHCDTCDHRAVAVIDIMRRTLQAHRRDAYTQERTPRPADLRNPEAAS